MADTLVILGGIVFTDHAIPNKINFGGKQRKKTNTLMGGQRVVDAMGPEANDIKWEGRFRGAAALDIAQTIDGMRIAGAQVEFSVFGLFYTVLIEEFTFTPEKYFEVPYTITLHVVDDPSQGIAGLISSLDSLVGGDLTSANTISAGL